MSIYKAGRPWKFDPTTGAGHRPPNSPGEYRMRDGSGCITYIGETNDLARRMREHIRSGKLPTGQGCGSTLEYTWWPTAAPPPAPAGSTSSSPSRSTTPP